MRGCTVFQRWDANNVKMLHGRDELKFYGKPRRIDVFFIAYLDRRRPSLSVANGDIHLTRPICHCHPYTLQCTHSLTHHPSALPYNYRASAHTNLKRPFLQHQPPLDLTAAPSPPPSDELMSVTANTTLRPPPSGVWQVFCLLKVLHQPPLSKAFKQLRCVFSCLGMKKVRNAEQKQQFQEKMTSAFPTENKLVPRVNVTSFLKAGISLSSFLSQ